MRVCPFWTRTKSGRAITFAASVLSYGQACDTDVMEIANETRGRYESKARNTEHGVVL
jgi:hypothetical protein